MFRRGRRGFRHRRGGFRRRRRSFRRGNGARKIRIGYRM